MSQKLEESRNRALVEILKHAKEDDKNNGYQAGLYEAYSTALEIPNMEIESLEQEVDHHNV